jgi:hypothetical protein
VMANRTAETQREMDTSERDLGIVGELISEPARWRDWISEDERRVALLQSAGVSVRNMAVQTEWDIQGVLDHLGCDRRASDELREMSVGQLRRSRAYIRWVEGLCGLVDRVTERRRIVVDSARLYRMAGRDLLWSQATMADGQMPPVEYLKLGEIDKAFQLAESRLSGIPFEVGAPHLRGKRIDRYLNDKDMTLSPLMRERIATHLLTCRLCADATRQRRIRRSRQDPK